MFCFFVYWVKIIVFFFVGGSVCWVVWNVVYLVDFVVFKNKRGFGNWDCFFSVFWCWNYIVDIYLVVGGGKLKWV